MNESKPINPKEVSVIAKIVQNVQSPPNRARKTQEQLLSEAADKLNTHPLSPFSRRAFAQAFLIADGTHERVARNPGNASDMTTQFKNALFALVDFRD